MKYIVDEPFESFKPWSGAVETFNRIIKAGKADEMEVLLSNCEPAGGWTKAAVNDLLWFDGDEVLGALGIEEGGEE